MQTLKTRALSTVSVLALAAAIMPAGVMAAEGTETDPIVISSAEELSAFAAEVDGGNDYNGKYVVLGSDIDLGAVANWNPIGAEGKANSNSGKLFAGSFDGQGHIISNLTISGQYTAEANVGLFSTLANTAYVKDIILTNVNISASQAASYVNVRAGGIAGDTARKSGSRGTVIDGCSVSGSVNVVTTDGIGMAGGIAGRLFTYSGAINCVSYADISAQGGANWGTAYAGGLFGMTGNNTLVANSAAFGSTNAYNVKSTTDDAYAGGIAGMLSSATYNCYAAGNAEITKNASAKHNYAGILAGQLAGSGTGNTNYFDDSAKITVNIGGGDTTVYDAVGWFEDNKLGQTEAPFAGIPEADTLTANIEKVSASINESDLVLRQWVVKDGKAVPEIASPEAEETAAAAQKLDAEISDGSQAYFTDVNISGTADFSNAVWRVTNNENKSVDIKATVNEPTLTDTEVVFGLVLTKNAIADNIIDKVEFVY